MLNFRVARPGHLIDLNRVDALAGIEVADGELVVGAMTRQRALERDPRVIREWPLLAEATRFIGHVQIRNRGTVGGSLSHNDPAAELPAVMTALDAGLVVESASGSRVIPPSEFFVGSLTTDLDPTELLAEIRIPAPAVRTGSAFCEISRRPGDFALVGVAIRIVLDQWDLVADARIALVGVGATTLLAADAAGAIAGRHITPATADEAGQLAAVGIDPPSDLHASAGYRRHVTAVLVRRALLRAAERAAGSPAS
jgi:CO/xanthine dehydrogenase FAD-binding subunit